MFNSFNGLNFSLKTLIVLAGVSLSACSSPGIMARHTDTERSAFHFFNSAARDGIVRMDIYGNPFNNDTATFDALVAQKFEGAYIGHPARFSTTADHEDFDNTRVAIYFQPARGVNRSTICKPNMQPDPPIMNDSPDFRAIAAFCVGQTSHSFTTVWSQMALTFNDPKFIDFIKSLARNVIPNPQLEPDNKCTALDC